MSSNNGTQYYQQDRVYDADAIAMAHPSQLPGGSYYYMIKKNGLPIKEATKKGFKEAFEGDYVNLQYPNSSTRRARVGGGYGYDHFSK